MATTTSCPVCGMTLERDNGVTSVEDGRTVTFCSQSCRLAYQDNPGAYAGGGRN